MPDRGAGAAGACAGFCAAGRYPIAGAGGVRIQLEWKYRTVPISRTVLYFNVGYLACMILLVVLAPVFHDHGIDNRSHGNGINDQPDNK